MLKLTFVICSLISIYSIRAQDMRSRVNTLVSAFEKSRQFKHAIVSISIAETSGGKIVYEKNSQSGLAPASCLKILTAATALDLFGEDFRYQTKFGYTGTVSDGILDGNIIITGSGDPSLGSERFKETHPDNICGELQLQLNNRGIESVRGVWQTDPRQTTDVEIPGGWIWDDIGNYYGAGFSVFNWHENSYRIFMKPGKKVGDPVVIVEKRPQNNFPVRSEITTGKKGSGDNAYVYFKPGTDSMIYRGTVPCCIDSFDIDAAMPDPARQMIMRLSTCVGTGNNKKENLPLTAVTSFYTHRSPTLAELTKPFLQKSINLYGESFLHLINTKNNSSDASGDLISFVQEFWEKKGIDKSAMQIEDGSGLSPGNRITTDALVKVLLYAGSRPWFSSFYDALPVINGLKMKSGYIEGTRSYTGFIKSKTGKEYCFSLIVNNYDKSFATVTASIFQLLDQLSKSGLD
ncbi:D-alanyl-D-alanine carboxypeptidase/D-alanyl-D-alanine-endopeptidase [Pollutibacter soli]|uniref:D-alanyl-D-alanine carboxypeptidase/D-alanyl-D-alanine endopeptidase n=1 Tax=Pollutibacter soli TaxID=3034157 RepID=UPI00301371F1